MNKSTQKVLLIGGALVAAWYLLKQQPPTPAPVIVPAPATPTS